MSQERELVPNIFLCYSPDEGLWYIERRIPGNWAISKKSYQTSRAAIIAYLAGKVEWKDA